MIPLVGHTLGHMGVAVESGGRWLLLASDAYFYREEMDLDRPRCTPGLRFYQWMMEKNRQWRLSNQARLRDLKRAHGGEVTIFSGHDIEEFERLSGRSARVPPEAMSTDRLQSIRGRPPTIEGRS
jgi:glyoxylase-like metal-dependent hydrolase (beta-lactamase superfamily II)